MSFIEHNQTNVIDKRRIVAQGEVELFGCGNDDVHRPQGIFVAGRQSARTVERGDREPQWRERLAKGALGLRRKRTQRGDDQYPFAGR